MKQNTHTHTHTQTSNANFWRASPFSITPVKTACKTRTCWYQWPFRLIYQVTNTCTWKLTSTVQKQLNQHKSSLSGNPVNRLKVNNDDDNTQNKRAVPFILSVWSQSQSVNKASVSTVTASASLEGVHTTTHWPHPPPQNTHKNGWEKKKKKIMLHNTINPFTAPACTISGLKGAHIHTWKQYIWWSCNNSAFYTVHFDRNPFTFSCKKKKKKGGGGGGALMISNLALSLVVFWVRVRQAWQRMG